MEIQDPTHIEHPPMICNLIFELYCSEITQSVFDRKDVKPYQDYIDENDISKNLFEHIAYLSTFELEDYQSETERAIVLHCLLFIAIYKKIDRIKQDKLSINLKQWLPYLCFSSTLSIITCLESHKAYFMQERSSKYEFSSRHTKSIQNCFDEFSFYAAQCFNDALNTNLTAQDILSLNLFNNDQINAKFDSVVNNNFDIADYIKTIS